MAAAGLCHSDDHIATGDLPVPPEAFPMAGGHEGAGVVEEVGRDTPGWSVGDKVVLSFLPACGFCRWCASGMHNLCDNGARILSGVREDGTRRMSLDGRPVGQGAGIATFSELSTVAVQSAIKMPGRRAARRGRADQLRCHHRLGVGGEVGRRRARATSSSSWGSAGSG